MDGTVRWVSEYEKEVLDLTVDRVRSLVVFTTGNEKIEAWDILTGTQKWLGQLDADTNVTAMGSSEYYGMMVTGLDDGKVIAWDTGTGALLWHGVAHDEAITQILIDRVQGVVMTGDESGRVTFWGIEDGAAISQVPPVVEETITTSAYLDEDRQILITTHGDGSVRAVRPDSLTLLWENVSAHHDYIRCTASDALRGIFITGGGDGLVHCWLIKSGMKLWTADRHCDDITALALDSSSGLLVSVSLDTTVRCFRLDNGFQVWAAIHPAIGRPVAAPGEGGVVLGAEATGKIMRRLRGQNEDEGGEDVMESKANPQEDVLLARAGGGETTTVRSDRRKKKRIVNDPEEEKQYVYNSHLDSTVKVRCSLSITSGPRLHISSILFLLLSLFCYSTTHSLRWKRMMYLSSVLRRVRRLDSASLEEKTGW